MWTIKTDLCRNGAARMLRMFVAACGRYLSPNNFWFFIDFVSNKNENIMNKARSSSYIHVKYINWKLYSTIWPCVHEINRHRCCFRLNGDRGVNARRAHVSPYIVCKVVSDKLTHIFHWKWSIQNGLINRFHSFSPFFNFRGVTSSVMTQEFQEQRNYGKFYGNNLIFCENADFNWIALCDEQVLSRLKSLCHNFVLFIDCWINNDLLAERLFCSLFPI